MAELSCRVVKDALKLCTEAKITVCQSSRCKTGELRIVFAVWIPPSGETGWLTGLKGSILSQATQLRMPCHLLSWHVKQVFHLTWFDTFLHFVPPAQYKLVEWMSLLQTAKDAGMGMLGTLDGTSWVAANCWVLNCRKFLRFSRHWLPLLWHYPLAFAVDTFTLAGFSPGLSLYVYNKDQKSRCLWLPYSFQMHNNESPIGFSLRTLWKSQRVLCWKPRRAKLSTGRIKEVG